MLIALFASVPCIASAVTQSAAGGLNQIVVQAGRFGALVTLRSVMFAVANVAVHVTVRLAQFISPV